MSPTIRAGASGTNQAPTIITNCWRTVGPTYRVRRLTPRECERLQGWPDDHTRWDDTGKELSDSARYKMCGNGISAPVAQWLGENIVASQNL